VIKPSFGKNKATLLFNVCRIIVGKIDLVLTAMNPNATPRMKVGINLIKSRWTIANANEVIKIAHFGPSFFSRGRKANPLNRTSSQTPGVNAMIKNRRKGERDFICCSSSNNVGA
jgi:hypothetical protein